MKQKRIEAKTNYELRDRTESTGEHGENNFVSAGTNKRAQIIIGSTGISIARFRKALFSVHCSFLIDIKNTHTHTHI